MLRPRRGSRQAEGMAADTRRYAVSEPS